MVVLWKMIKTTSWQVTSRKFLSLPILTSPHLTVNVVVNVLIVIHFQNYHNFLIHLHSSFLFIQGATTGEIKKQYRKLSLKYHPDKETGDSVRFMRIAKAYEAWVLKYFSGFDQYRTLKWKGKEVISIYYVLLYFSFSLPSANVFHYIYHVFILSNVIANLFLKS